MKRFLCALLLVVPVFAGAEEARDLADNPAIERRMINLAEKVRCLVCQSENVASSRSDWSNDVRQIMRDKMMAGATDQEIMDLLVERFGKSVLFDPPVDRETMPLWAAPFVLLLLGIGILLFQLRKRRATVPEPALTPEAVQRAATLLEEESKS
ncbi:cytochrome c-type biogenesis protein CcmH [Ferrigenium sp. UT5]|uniref:cytochrome c-type biogenesis protein n=1 Tax=Ferrigenium sp. UT5 TaxID=3242105 RepID=UPI00354C58FE